MLCNNVGKSPSAAAVEIGLSKPSVNRWKNGGSPTDATATKIASYFGISVTALLGKDEQKDLTINNDSRITKTKKDMINKIMHMSEDELLKFDLLLRLVESK